MSNHLQSIIDKNNQLTSIQVTFIDIEKYSQRRTSSQVSIINEFTNCLNLTLQEISKEYLDFAQNNNYNFKSDIIIIPTGDGAAINFTFDGLHNIHIKFAEFFLKNQNIHNQKSEVCEKFEANGWCNCHNKFNVRIGLAEGKAIIYKDINDNFNVAGNPINMAARLLGEANRNQIILTESAYKQAIDLSENPNYSDEFIKMQDVEFKHGLKMNIFVLKSDQEYINNEINPSYLKKQKLKSISERMQAAGNSNIDYNSPNSDKEITKNLIDMTSSLIEFIKTAQDIDDSDSSHDIPELEVINLNKKTRRGK